MIIITLAINHRPTSISFCESVHICSNWEMAEEAPATQHIYSLNTSSNKSHHAYEPTQALM